MFGGSTLVIVRGQKLDAEFCVHVDTNQYAEYSTTWSIAALEDVHLQQSSCSQGIY